MGDRKRFDVVRSGEQWQVKSGGQVMDRAGTKTKALQEGRRLAHKAEPSALYIHRANGTIQDERTYG
jgi:hypothetical protein